MNSIRDVSSAILLAAGRGTRLRPHTDQTPKPLLPWRAKPTLEWVLESLNIAGIKRVVIVTGYLQEQIVDFVDSIDNSPLEISCVEQTILDGTAGAVSCALNHRPGWFDKESYLVSATDYLVPNSFYPEFAAFHKHHSAAISVSLKAVPEHELSGRSSVAYSGDFDISRVVEKPDSGFAPSPYSANLVYIFPSTINHLIHRIEPSPRGEREIQSAVNTYLISDGTAKGLLQPTPLEWSAELL